MKQYVQSQLQSQVQVNNMNNEIDSQKANYFLNDTHFKAQSAEVSQGNQLYHNLQQNKPLNQNVLENPNTFDDNNSNLFQKQFNSNNENALQYLNISSQNNTPYKQPVVRGSRCFRKSNHWICLAHS